jgi:hypothetical protein
MESMVAGTFGSPLRGTLLLFLLSACGSVAGEPSSAPEKTEQQSQALAGLSWFPTQGIGGAQPIWAHVGHPWAAVEIAGCTGQPWGQAGTLVALNYDGSFYFNVDGQVAFDGTSPGDDNGWRYLETDQWATTGTTIACTQNDIFALDPSGILWEAPVPFTTIGSVPQWQGWQGWHFNEVSSAYAGVHSIASLNGDCDLAAAYGTVCPPWDVNSTSLDVLGTRVSQVFPYIVSQVWQGTNNPENYPVTWSSPTTIAALQVGGAFLTLAPAGGPGNGPWRHEQYVYELGMDGTIWGSPVSSGNWMGARPPSNVTPSRFTATDNGYIYVLDTNKDLWLLEPDYPGE